MAHLYAGRHHRAYEPLRDKPKARLSALRETSVVCPRINYTSGFGYRTVEAHPGIRTLCKAGTEVIAGITLGGKNECYALGFHNAKLHKPGCQSGRCLGVGRYSSSTRGAGRGHRGTE